MHIVITGGLGYIGQTLTRELSRAGHRISVFARNTRNQGNEASFELVRADICDLCEISLSADMLLHLACANGSAEDTDADYALTVHGTKKLLEWCVNNGIPNFVLFSTAQVYGNLHGRKITEDTSISPVNDYGLTHAFAEQILQMYVRNRKLRGIVIRPTIIYGGLDPETVRWSITPACFCKEAVEQDAITLRTNGAQFRNYVPIGYVGQSVRRLLEYSKDLRDYEVFNLSGIETLPILAVARKVKRIAETRFHKPVRLEVQQDDTRSYSEFDISRLKIESLVGSTPASRLDEAIEEMLESLSNHGC